MQRAKVAPGNGQVTSWPQMSPSAQELEQQEGRHGTTARSWRPFERAMRTAHHPRVFRPSTRHRSRQVRVKEADTIFADAKGNPQGAEGMANIPDGLLDAAIESAEECPGECIFIET